MIDSMGIDLELYPGGSDDETYVTEDSEKSGNNKNRSWTQNFEKRRDAETRTVESKSESEAELLIGRKAVSESLHAACIPPCFIRFCFLSRNHTAE